MRDRLLAAGVGGCGPNEEQLWDQVGQQLTEPAEEEIRGLPTRKRRKALRSAVRGLKALDARGWEPVVTGLADPGARRPDVLYRVEGDEAALLDCTVQRGRSPSSGHCAAFEHQTPTWVGSRRARQTLPLELDLDDDLTAFSPPSRVKLDSSGAEAEGIVVINQHDVIVEQAFLVVPHPRGGGSQLLSVHDPDTGRSGGFSLISSRDLRTTESWSYGWEVGTPDLLEAAYGETFTVIRFDAAVTYRRGESSAGYQLETRGVLLNKERVNLRIDYAPGHHMSLRVDRLDVPMGLPFMCAPVTESLVEIDYVNDRFRLIGGVEVDALDTLMCAHPGGISYATEFAVEIVSDVVLDVTRVPTSTRMQFHLVLDFDDRTLCSDLSIGRRSYLNAAYFGTEQRLALYSPADIEGAPFSIGKLGKELAAADFHFPRSRQRTCWDGDSGPISDTFNSGLPTWDH